MTRRPGWMAGTLLAVGLTAVSGGTAGAQALPIGAEALSRLDLLPTYRTSVKVGMVSSYDRTGGNDDGFSGRYSFVRKEGDALVIADLKGPGVIYRIWTPTPTDDPMEFYFDGETQPRLRLTFRQLFDGTVKPFTAPVAGYGGGGFFSYVPMPYRTSCKVVIRAPRVQFYQVNFATYPEGTALESFRPGDPASNRNLDEARRLLAQAGGDISAAAAGPSAERVVLRAGGALEPGRSLTLCNLRKPGRIVGLRVSPASAFEGKERSTLLRITWDGETKPAVLCPAGDFFGYSWGKSAARSLLTGTSGDTCYAYFPMPFDRSAKVELVSERTGGAAVAVKAEVVYTREARRPDEGKFYAVWHRENPTTNGKPFTFVETEGQGHVVGVALQSQGLESGSTPFFEGDDEAIIDGEVAGIGTGSEDFFNGGWYDVPGRWESRFSFPLSGCLDYQKALARSGAYRLFLTDAYAFRKSIRLTIEHGPEKNAVPTDYAGVAYLYLDRPPTNEPAFPAAEARMVKDLDSLVYTPGWNVPMHSFSIENATLTKKFERIAGADVRYLSMRAQRQDVFGPHSISFLCEVPRAGRYVISIDAVQGPEQAMVQLFRQEHGVGEIVDLYAPERGKSRILTLGTLDLAEGVNQVFFKLVGKNADSKGLGFDLVNLYLRREP